MSQGQVRLIKPKTQKGKRILKLREPQQVSYVRQTYLNVAAYFFPLPTSKCLCTGRNLQEGFVSLRRENIPDCQGSILLVLPYDRTRLVAERARCNRQCQVLLRLFVRSPLAGRP